MKLIQHSHAIAHFTIRICNFIPSLLKCSQTLPATSRLKIWTCHFSPTGMTVRLLWELSSISGNCIPLVYHETLISKNFTVSLTHCIKMSPTRILNSKAMFSSHVYQQQQQKKVYLTSMSFLICSSWASSSSFRSRRAWPTSAARMRSFSSIVELLSWSDGDANRLFALTPGPMMRCRLIGVDEEKGKKESSRLGEVMLSFRVEIISTWVASPYVWFKCGK